LIDAIIPRKELKPKLISYLGFLSNGHTSAAVAQA